MQTSEVPNILEGRVRKVKVAGEVGKLGSNIPLDLFIKHYYTFDFHILYYYSIGGSFGYKISGNRLSRFSSFKRNYYNLVQKSLIYLIIKMQFENCRYI